MSNDGFFGPDSIAWRVHGDPSGLVSGIRSLMVQSLHPRAMAAVAQHSDFRTDFWGRLRRTSDYLMTIVYGTTEEAEATSAVVRAVHSRISGVDDYTGLPYRADEPELLVWIHNATVQSYLVGYELYGKPLSPEDADQYVAEMRILGKLVSLEEGDVAKNRAELDEYFVNVEPSLSGSPSAKEAVRLLLAPQLPLRLRPLWGVPAIAAVASMPPSYRKMLALPWLGVLQPGVTVSTKALVTGLRLLMPPPPIVEAAQARRP